MDSPFENPTRQAFGSPGGKSFLAPRIASMIPPHKTYVEPFAGGAAVLYYKDPSQKEVLNDKDSEIAFGHQFIKGMTNTQLNELNKLDWVQKQTTFDKVKDSYPKDKTGRFRRFYYTTISSFASGRTSFNTIRDGHIGSLNRLQPAHERLKGVTIQSKDASSVIRQYDSPTTFFYLDPPYPGRHFSGEKYTTEELNRLIEQLKHIKGKFALSLGTEHAKLLPKSWNIKRVKVKRNMTDPNTGQPIPSGYEIVASNYRSNGMGKQKVKDNPILVEAITAGLASGLAWGVGSVMGNRVASKKARNPASKRKAKRNPTKKQTGGGLLGFAVIGGLLWWLAKRDQ